MREDGENWIVEIHRAVEKGLTKLPEIVRHKFFDLLLEIRFNGPVRGNWKNYGKLSNDKHHCHIKKGHPTYVCCWKAYPLLKAVEIYYVGTHENAPY